MLRSQLNFKTAVVLSLITMVVFFSPNSKASTVGFEYHTFVRKAKSFDIFENCNDSIFYFYDLARKNDVFFIDDHWWFFRTSILTNKVHIARELVIKGAEKGMSWKDFELGISQAHYTDQFYREKGDTLPNFNQSLKLKDIISKDAFKKKYRKLRGNRKFQKLFRKIDRLDQMFSRKTNSDKDIEKLVKRDLEVYNLIYGFIKSIGKIPKIDEVGYEAHEILSVCIIHMNAEQIRSLLPYLIEAINDGSYYYNEDLAYAIEINALYSGEYILRSNASFKILKDTTNRIAEGIYYSYLGELYFPIPDTSQDEPLFGIPTINPYIKLDEIEELRKVLCLAPYQKHLSIKHIVVQSKTEFLRTIERWY